MTQPTFNYVEEYMEFIGGYRAASGKKLGLFDQVPSPLSLARYDVNIVNSMACQTAEMNNPYTDKQAVLAVRIVDKYRKQLLGLGIVVPEKLEKFKLGIRIVDRSKKAFVEDNKFILRFPYDTKLIELVKKQAREGHGSAQFDNDRKVWIMAMTEHMLNWIMTVSKIHDIEVSEEIVALYQQMLDIENAGFKIELDIVGDQVEIANAPDSLINYINDKLGGMSIDNLLTLVDNSELLGFTVSEDVITAVKQQYSEYGELVYKRKIALPKGDESMDKVLAYARLVNRLPIHVYETGLPKNNTDEIVYLNRGIGYDIAPKLLVTTTSLMIGSRKESWLTNSEKIIVIE